MSEPKITGVTKITREVFNEDGSLTQLSQDVRSYEKPFKAIPKNADSMREYFMDLYKKDYLLIETGHSVAYSFGHSRGRAGVLVRG